MGSRRKRSFQKTITKIIAQKGNYTQIEVGSLIKEGIKKENEILNLDYQPKGKFYYIVDHYFDTINCIFNNALSKSDKLYLVDELEDQIRLLRYDYPIKGEKYWVLSSLVKREEIVTTPTPPPIPLPTISVLPPLGFLGGAATASDRTTAVAPTSTADNTSAVDSPAKAEEATTVDPEPAEESTTGTSSKEVPLTNQAKLTADVDELYLEAPVEGEEDETLAKEQILRLADFKTKKDKDGMPCYLVVCSDTEKERKVTKKGWIKEDDAKLKKISAYNWEEFGFKITKDQQDEFIYDADAPPSFLKEAWKHVDTDGNKALSAQELRYAFNNPEFCERFSLLVCQHSSEWSLGGDKWPSYKSKLETLLDEGINQEEDPERKDELKKKKKARLEAIEARVKNLYWWKEIEPGEKKDEGFLPDSINKMLPDAINKAGKSVLDWLNEEKEPEIKPEAASATAPVKEEKLKGPTPFPVADSKVYHFHPVAFVRQMRRLYNNINKKYRWAHSSFGRLIAEKESANNYNICNQTKGGLKVVRNVVVVATTIKSIQEKQKTRDIFAVGRYQLIPITLDAAVKALKIDINQKLDEEMQDRIFDEFLLSIKRPKIAQYLKGNGSVEEAMYESAKEWASIGVEKGKKISKNRIAKGGESYYAGDGLNKAHITPDEIKKALINSKNEK